MVPGKVIHGVDKSRSGRYLHHFLISNGFCPVYCAVMLP
jgi:hypothetical protein